MHDAAAVRNQNGSRIDAEKEHAKTNGDFVQHGGTSEPDPESHPAGRAVATCARSHRTYGLGRGRGRRGPGRFSGAGVGSLGEGPVLHGRVPLASRAERLAEVVDVDAAPAHAAQRQAKHLSGPA